MSTNTPTRLPVDALLPGDTITYEEVRLTVDSVRRSGAFLILRGMDLQTDEELEIRLHEDSHVHLAPPTDRSTP